MKPEALRTWASQRALIAQTKRNTNRPINRRNPFNVLEWAVALLLIGLTWYLLYRFFT
ncbi:hypothetical protein IQ22_00683 [Pseudomonas duriflava]|uniref:Uncharacterized protein n=1 Tax=Pseudomonas duriflava TaxID=459528 RepID=A0A562QL31_9PSED|nr:hypothetical protein [Pseudomonas duriflava]TWI57467.1 hypothetical protein IQ22_00683 [Pseudomonas duriflava]